MSDQESLMRAIYEKANRAKRAAKGAAGLGEVAAQIATSGIAEVGGGLAYIPAAIAGGDAAGQAVKNAVSQAFTYQPRIDRGQNISEGFGRMVAPIGQAIGEYVDTAADAAYEFTGSPVVGAAVKTAPNALLELIDKFGAAKKMAPAPVISEMVAYHGTPHDFDQFDISKIGTGEGAQVYGHGLYFSESPDVAQRYAEQLARPEMVDSPNHFMARDVRRELDRLRRETPSELWGREIVEGHFSKMAEPGSPSEMIGDAFFKMVDDGDIEYNGRFYTVDIPDEAVAKFLDWDKPLSEQPHVIDAWKKENADWMGPFESGTGKDLIKMVAARFDGDQAAAAKYLNSQGIPGIRYLDAGSRDGGTGTSNFVVFDDKLVKVIKKE